MVQSRQRLRLPQSSRGRGDGRGYLRPHGDGSPIADRRPSAGPAIGGSNRRGAQRPDGRRTSRSLIIRAIAFGMVAALAACQPSASNAVELGQSPAGLEQLRLTISSHGKNRKFTVEVARTPEEQAQGLMFRQVLDPDRGMIFPMEPPRQASFWMK